MYIHSCRLMIVYRSCVLISVQQAIYTHIIYAIQCVTSPLISSAGFLLIRRTLQRNCVPSSGRCLQLDSGLLHTRCQGGHARARSIPRPRAGSRPLLQCEGGCDHSSQFAEHVQGVEHRCGGFHCTHPWPPHGMGQTGSPAT